MNSFVLWTSGGLGLILVALAASSAWLKSRYFYYSILTIQTAWLVGLAFIAVAALENNLSTIIALFAGLIAVYFLLVYFFAYKYILQEHFLQTVHPERLKQALLTKRKPNALDRTIVNFPWVSLAFLAVAVVAAVYAGH